MAKQIVNNSEENIAAFTEALKVYKQKIENLKKKATMKEGVKENHTLFDIVQKLITLQNQNEDNLVSRADLTDSEYSRLSGYAKYRKISIEEVLDSLADNIRYVARGKSFDFVAKLANASADIEAVFNRYYKYKKQFPINALSDESMKFISNLETGLSANKNIELILRVLHPELIKPEEEFNSTSRALRITRDKFEIQSYANIVRNNYADKEGNIDKIFSEGSESFFVELTRFLEGQYITFDEFVREYVSTPEKKYDYTHCYTADSTKIGPKLVEYYAKRYKTTKNMQDNDMYLFSKLRSAMDVLNIHEIGKLIEYWGIPNDNPESYNMLSEADLNSREGTVKTALRTRYGGVVPDKLKMIDRRLYESITLLARRRGFTSVDDYLESIGMTRTVPASTATTKGINFFSDYDFERYEIFKDKSAEEIEAIMGYLNIKLIPADEKHIRTYRNMAYDKKDSREYFGENPKSKTSA